MVLFAPGPVRQLGCVKRLHFSHTFRNCCRPTRCCSCLVIQLGRAEDQPRNGHSLQDAHLPLKRCTRTPSSSCASTTCVFCLVSARPLLWPPISRCHAATRWPSACMGSQGLQGSCTCLEACSPAARPRNVQSQRKIWTPLSQVCAFEVVLCGCAAVLRRRAPPCNGAGMHVHGIRNCGCESLS